MTYACENNGWTHVGTFQRAGIWFSRWRKGKVHRVQFAVVLG